MPISRQDAAFILHTRPYRNSSALIKFFSQHHGVLSGIVRSAQGASAKNSALVQAFIPLQLQWLDRNELKTIQTLEELTPPLTLQSEHLYSAMYMNELLYRLLHEGEATPLLFELYRETLAALAQRQAIEPLLRTFEKFLLNELGYGVSYEYEAETGALIEDEGYYQFVADVGFIRHSMPQGLSSATVCFKGQDIRAIGRNDFTETTSRRAAKVIMREALAIHLGQRALYSRSLFIKSPKDL